MSRHRIAWYISCAGLGMSNAFILSYFKSGSIMALLFGIVMSILYLIQLRGISRQLKAGSENT